MVVKGARMVASCKIPEDHPRFSLYCFATDCTVHATTLGGLDVQRRTTTRESLALPSNNHHQLWWLDVAYPTCEELQVIYEMFGLHVSTIEEIAARGLQEKFQVFPGYHFARFQALNIAANSGFDPYAVHILVLREGIITFNYRRSNFISTVRQWQTGRQNLYRLSSDWASYNLM